MKAQIVMVAALVIGAVITLATGQLPPPVTQLQVDVAQYGAPLPWTSRVIPTNFTNYDYINLAADIAVWALIAYLVIWFATSRRRNPQPSPTPPSK